ncbi:hypothetical protein STEG23_025105 [Scotinomys teguina]
MRKRRCSGYRLPGKMISERDGTVSARATTWYKFRGPDGQKVRLKRNSLQKVNFATGDCGDPELLTI